jgi:hypothetical protein
MAVRRNHGRSLVHVSLQPCGLGRCATCLARNSAPLRPSGRVASRATDETRPSRGVAHRGEAVPLTPFQHELLATLASNPTDDRYLAAGAAMHFAPNSVRFSDDLDFFHDSEARVGSAFTTQSATIDSSYRARTRTWLHRESCRTSARRVVSSHVSPMRPSRIRARRSRPFHLCVPREPMVSTRTTRQARRAPPISHRDA